MPARCVRPHNQLLKLELVNENNVLEADTPIGCVTVPVLQLRCRRRAPRWYAVEGGGELKLGVEHVVDAGISAIAAASEGAASIDAAGAAQPSDARSGDAGEEPTKGGGPARATALVRGRLA